MKRLKKGDIILAFSLLAVALVLFVSFLLLKKSGEKVLVKVDGKTVYSGYLSSDNELKLKHNTVVIKDGRAFMKCADCKNQICVNTGKISKSGETVVCLPNRVIVEIE